jgi:hypothetical protein
VIKINDRGLPEADVTKLSGPDLILKSRDVDGAIREAKDHLRGLGKKVHSINVDANNNIHAVVARGKKNPQRPPTGWRFRRPAGQRL